MFVNHPLIFLPFSLRMRQKDSDFNISFLDIYTFSFTNVLPPWQLKPEWCNLSFMKILNNRAPQATILQHFLSLQYKYESAEFYSHASKTATIVSCASHGANFDAYRTMSSYIRIYATEAYGLLIIAQHILERKVSKHNKYTDFFSLVCALASQNPWRNRIVH